LEHIFYKKGIKMGVIFVFGKNTARRELVQSKKKGSTRSRCSKVPMSAMFSKKTKKKSKVARAHMGFTLATCLLGRAERLQGVRSPSIIFKEKQGDS
jgi:aconitase B